MKTIILCFSNHHGNTKRLAKAIADTGVQLVDINRNPEPIDLSGYDLIGIASGIYAGNFAKQMQEYVKANLPEDKKVFLLYSYAKKMDHYTKSIKEILDEKKSTIVGEYSCQGFNTFGPFKLIGGTAKGHPTKEEIDGAVKFYQGLL